MQHKTFDDAFREDELLGKIDGTLSQLLPSQFYGALKKKPDVEKEQTLLIALLLDGMRDFDRSARKYYAIVDSPDDKPLTISRNQNRRNALSNKMKDFELWCAGDWAELSLATFCDAFDLDFSWMTEGLKTWTKLIRQKYESGYDNGVRSPARAVFSSPRTKVSSGHIYHSGGSSKKGSKKGKSHATRVFSR